MRTNKNTSDYRNIASTRVLTRVLIYLSEVDNANQSTISRSILVSQARTKDALLWLTNHGIVSKIEIKGNGGTTHYAYRKEAKKPL